MPYKCHTSTALFTASSSIASLQREIEELKQKEQTPGVIKRLEIKSKALELLEEEAACDKDDKNADEPEQ